jgi:hypothetical protein
MQTGLKLFKRVMIEVISGPKMLERVMISMPDLEFHVPNLYTVI